MLWIRQLKRRERNKNKYKYVLTQYKCVLLLTHRNAITRITKESIMETITVSKSDLKEVLEWFKDFVVEDGRSCDLCKFCGMRYGNAKSMFRLGEKLTHYQNCAYLVAQDLSTGL
jgi:hypothetical protein